MRPQDIKIGEIYRHRTSPNYGYVLAVKILKAKQDENIYSYSIVKCRHSTDKNFDFGIIRYFRPCDLIKNS